MRDPEMMSPFEVKTGKSGLAVALRVDQIDIGFRLRAVDPEKVKALAASIEEIGLRTAVTVSGDWHAVNDPAIRVTIVAGAHRLEAMRLIGREWIAAEFAEGDDLDAELWEIDENLCRADLTPADRALFVFRRKEIYLMRHPETAVGNPGVHRQVGDARERAADKRFSAATAEATGQSERAVQRDAERGEKISEKALRMLRGTRHDKGVVLDRLKGLRDEEQIVVVQALFDEDRRQEAEAKSIRTEKMATKRAVRTGIINAIADKGTLAAGSMPRAAFAVGYADPPWEQEAWSEETGQDKGLMYPPMALDEIKALCAGEASPFTRDAVLYLWVTTNRLHHGIEVLAAWGFDYVSAITWDKVHIGMGRWVRDRTEHLLIGKRGDFPGLEMGTQPESLHAEVKSRHSRKPVHFAEEIDRLFPTMRKLELFQRRDSLADGDVRLNGLWHFWGLEAGLPEDEAVEPAPAPDVPPPSADDLVEYKALAAIDGGLTIRGPLFDLLVERGLVFTVGEPELSFDGSARLAELETRVQAHSDGEAVTCAPASPPSKLPPAPGPTAPVEFSVGGMKKGSFARFSVHRNDDGTFSLACEYLFAGHGGGSSPRTGAITGYDAALRHGLMQLRAQLGPVAGSASADYTKSHRAAARAGLRWISAKMDEWGLGPGGGADAPEGEAA